MDVLANEELEGVFAKEELGGAPQPPKSFDAEVVLVCAGGGAGAALCVETASLEPHALLPQISAPPMLAPPKADGAAGAGAGGETCAGFGWGEDRLNTEPEPAGGLVVVGGGDETAWGGGAELRLRRSLEKDCEGGGLVFGWIGCDAKPPKSPKPELEGCFW